MQRAKSIPGAHEIFSTANSCTGTAIYQRLRALWTQIMTSPTHLDAVLSKVPVAERATSAAVMHALLRQPVSNARKYRIGSLRPGEPWSLTRNQLAAWPAAHELTTKLYDLAQNDPNALKLPAGDYLDFPPSMTQQWVHDWGQLTADEMAAVLSAPPPHSLVPTCFWVPLRSPACHLQCILLWRSFTRPVCMSRSSVCLMYSRYLYLLFALVACGAQAVSAGRDCATERGAAGAEEQGAAPPLAL